MQRIYTERGGKSMSPNGRMCFFVLIMACTVFATVFTAGPADAASADNNPFMAKKMMMKCYNQGYPLPKMTLLKTIFNNSNPLEGGRAVDQSNNLLSTFLQVQDLVTGVTNKNSPNALPMDAPETWVWNCSNLPAVIRMIKNSVDPSCCYMKAFVAPMSWAMLRAQPENYFNSSDYKTLLWAAKPVLEDIPSARMMLPARVGKDNMGPMMNMLTEVYTVMTEEQRDKVLNWAKEQVLQNNFSCTMRPSSRPRSTMLESCKPTLEWLDSETLTMMGPYLSNLRPDDVDSSPKETLCGFFLSGQLRSNMTTKMNPSLGRKFLQRIKECSNVSEQIDKLGPLACYYDASNLTPSSSKKLLSLLDDCDPNPTIFELKKRLVNSVMTGSNKYQELRDLGSSVTLLSPKQLSKLTTENLKSVLENLETGVKWSRSQLRVLVKNQLGEKKCDKLSGEKLMELQSVAAGLPSCVLKNVKPQDILSNTETMKTISKQLRKGQLKTTLQGLSENVPPSELVQKLDGPLLRSISLKALKKANISSLEEVENKTWSLPQAAYLAKKMHDQKQLHYRRLNSVFQGITCNMIDQVNDSYVLDMAQSITETPQWLSKFQAQCAAWKVFNTLEKERPDYFKNITVLELERIPTVLLIHLLPSKIKELPQTLCPVFLGKMEMADLTSLPPRAPSRPALTERALRCLLNGKNISGLTSPDVPRLGPLLCEMKPSTLRLMAPEVLKFSLQAMASCEHIPQPHWTDLIQLVNQVFGSPSDWPAETMESLGPLILMDDNATSSLPNKPWMKDVLIYLKPRLTQISDALRKKIFDLTTDITASNVARKRRAAIEDLSSNGTEPTVAFVEELGLDNVFWTAANLELLSNSTFLATVETLGSVPGYSSDQLDRLYRKAVEVFGPVANMTEDVIVQLGCITQGFSNSELEKLPFSLDSLDEIGACGWRDSQLASVWKAVAEYNNLTAKLLGSAEMVQLSRFICGLSSKEISQLSVAAFSDAVGSLDAPHCPVKVLQELKNVAISAFGDPCNWTEAQVSDLNNIIAGLNNTEMASLSPSVFPFISKSSISQIPPENFAALSVVQMLALGPDNAAMVTSEQREVLTEEQLSVLEKVRTGESEEGKQSQSTESGAPMLNLEGISTFMKPILVLLFGFLLL
ncbi:otoancorin isoform X2 [Cyprinodon tularosa]|uniref:otoancorin isoform X2 n=1 Tax=Cyprinodon tularosa TaxID=77115 RepID=UPI0018E24EDB|nr:otoancorin isoform X2 [Cyprinodon tularosa]